MVKKLEKQYDAGENLSSIQKIDEKLSILRESWQDASEDKKNKWMKMIDEQLNHIQKQYGKIESAQEIGKGAELSVEIKNEEAAIDTTPVIEFDQIKGKKNITALSAAKVGDTLELVAKGLFTEDSASARAFGLTLSLIHI